MNVILFALPALAQLASAQAQHRSPNIDPDTAVLIESSSVAEVAFPGPDNQKLDAVAVSGHYRTAVGTSDASSQGVVSGKLIQDIPLLRPGEALETVPGMVVTQHSGDGKANQYFLRGYNLDHGIDFASYIDGVPVNMPTNAHGQGYSDVNYMIPELIQGIEYSKGPYFPQTGDFSSAGSARIEYRKSLDENFADLTIGDDNFRRLLLAGSTKLGKGAEAPTLLAAVEGEKTDGPWVVPEKMRKLNTMLRLSQDGVDSQWSLDAIHYQARWNATDQVPLELIQSGQLDRYGAVDPYDGGKTTRDIVSGRWRSSNEAGFYEASAYLQRYTLGLWSNFTLYADNPQLGDQMYQSERRAMGGAQLARGWNHELLGRESVTEVGVQLRRDNLNVSMQHTFERVPYETVTNDDVRLTDVGLYFSNNTPWNSWLRTIVGARVENESMKLSSRVSSNGGSESATKFLPKFSAIFGPWAKTEVFVNAGKGVHSNDARGVVNKLDPNGDPVTPSAVLSTSLGREVGLRTEVVEGLQSSVAIWDLRNQSEILYSADVGGTSAHGPTRRYGVEWNNHWIAGRYFLFDADLAWSHSRFVNDNDSGNPGNYIPNSVSRVATFRASVHDLGPWSAGIEARYISGYPLNQDNSLRAPSAFVTNLRLQTALNKKTDLTVDVLNLFDRKYYDIAYAQEYRVSPTAPITDEGVTVHPGEPREIRVSLKYRF